MKVNIAIIFFSLFCQGLTAEVFYRLTSREASDLAHDEASTSLFAVGSTLLVTNSSNNQQLEVTVKRQQSLVGIGLAKTALEHLNAAPGTTLIVKNQQKEPPLIGDTGNKTFSNLSDIKNNNLDRNLPADNTITIQTPEQYLELPLFEDQPQPQGRTEQVSRSQAPIRALDAAEKITTSDLSKLAPDRVLAPQRPPVDDRDPIEPAPPSAPTLSPRTRALKQIKSYPDIEAYSPPPVKVPPENLSASPAQITTIETSPTPTGSQPEERKPEPKITGTITSTEQPGAIVPSLPSPLPLPAMRKSSPPPLEVAPPPRFSSRPSVNRDAAPQQPLAEPPSTLPSSAQPSLPSSPLAGYPSAQPTAPYSRLSRRRSWLIEPAMASPPPSRAQKNRKMIYIQVGVYRQAQGVKNFHQRFGPRYPTEVLVRNGATYCRLGPFTAPQAQELLPQVRRQVNDAFIVAVD